MDGESDSSSVSFDSDADFELDFERVPEQARAKVLQHKASVQPGSVDCAVRGSRAVGGPLNGRLLL